MKKAIFHPRAIEVVRGFPEQVKDEIGQLLFMLQEGKRLTMPSSRPMPLVGSGVEELRVRWRDGIYRAFYYARSARGILVIHAFMKKTGRTAAIDIQLGRRRLREMLNEET